MLLPSKAICELMEVASISRLCRPMRGGKGKSLDHVREVFACPREPPITHHEADDRDGREVSKARPVRSYSFEKDPAIAPHKGCERIQIDEHAKPFWNDR